MTRRTHAEIAAEAVAAERAAVAAYAESQAQQLVQMVERRRISAAEADMLTERMRAFAGGIKAGLHLP